jgi:SP family arabinose:H+ symporter-like MFS transporter
MKNQQSFSTSIALIAALGGFLMGFDASVISGVVKFIEPEFNLTKLELGWSVASLALTASLAMMIAGPLSDKFGRVKILKLAALLFALSAIGSAIAQSYVALIIARMVGGIGVGAALIIAPMYIAEIAPAVKRGKLVSFNQLNIVIGISAAFFSNYFILKLGQSDVIWMDNLRFEEWNWRWMLGVETIPALLYFIALQWVPESPRWLIMKQRNKEALDVLYRLSDRDQADRDYSEITQGISHNVKAQNNVQRFSELFSKPLRLVLFIGLTIAVVQQITGINAVFFYAPMIFEQTGIGTDASFIQAILVGLINLIFTVLALYLIDKVGRKALLVTGLSGIACFMFLLAYGFYSASYTLTQSSLIDLASITGIEISNIAPLAEQTFHNDLSFRSALSSALSSDQLIRHESEFINAAITINPTLILIGILGFVACFAFSIGPVMWVLFSELFPNSIRAIAISFVGLVNSAVSFLVQLLFPMQLVAIGNAGTFLIYGLFALLGLSIIIWLLPETKGKSLEALEELLVPDH